VHPLHSLPLQPAATGFIIPSTVTQAKVVLFSGLARKPLKIYWGLSSPRKEQCKTNHYPAWKHLAKQFLREDPAFPKADLLFGCTAFYLTAKLKFG